MDKTYGFLPGTLIKGFLISMHPTTEEDLLSYFIVPPTGYLKKDRKHWHITSYNDCMLILKTFETIPFLLNQLSTNPNLEKYEVETILDLKKSSLHQSLVPNFFYYGLLTSGKFIFTPATPFQASILRDIQGNTT